MCIIILIKQVKTKTEIKFRFDSTYVMNIIGSLKDKDVK